MVRVFDSAAAAAAAAVLETYRTHYYGIFFVNPTRHEMVSPLGGAGLFTFEKIGRTAVVLLQQQ